MKKIFAVTAVALSLGTAASANTGTFVLEGYGVDTSGLDRATINALNAAVHGSGSESEKRQVVRSIIKQAGQ
ncbi:MAG: hypothetical protein AAF626_13685 [Pseudomonadota bacterium]